MKKPDIAKSMARRSGVSQAEAADHLDGVVQQILNNLRKSGEAELPGLGKLIQGLDGQIAFEHKEVPRRG